MKSAAPLGSGTKIFTLKSLRGMKGLQDSGPPSAVSIASGFGTFFISSPNKSHPDHPGVSCILC